MKQFGFTLPRWGVYKHSSGPTGMTGFICLRLCRGCTERDGTTRWVLGFFGGEAVRAQGTDSEKGWRALPAWWGDIWVPRSGGRFLHIQSVVIRQEAGGW